MTDLDVAAPLAAALSAKGFVSLTPVQEAVLAPEARARDLLVSAQTGSGKTVAFGLAMAPQILAGEDRLRPAEAPLALAIAPTRELALQVARELAWLYEGTGGQVATCVGGMDQRQERRMLERGPHVVVGTPGRLRDHIERGHLDLGGLRACVLDEADEMLDLGFREDLEFILGAAAPARRTLMFSATVPRAIEELATHFQRDALRIATRGEARQHADIEYRALSVSPRDRENAIFNLLRFQDARTAIVFCKTRANVSHLFARMGNRGFPVVALSGELSQAERTHALQALRDGRARVCIATDVAARGIDLPGLDLVIHADLPTNSETLLHRSGRTGRAGAKGVSALIVTPAEFRKAQRLLQGARVEAEWGRAPSAQEVQERDDARILEHPSLAPEPGEEAPLAAALLERFGPERVAAAFVRLWREGRSAPEELSDAPEPRGDSRSDLRSPALPRERAAFGDVVWFALPVGRSGRAEARWLLPKICEAGGVTKEAVGAIRVQAEETFVQVAAAQAHRFGEGIEVVPGLVMRRLPEAPVLERPEGPARRPERRPSNARWSRDDARDRLAPPDERRPRGAQGKPPVMDGKPIAEPARPKPPRPKPAMADARDASKRTGSPRKPKR
jgi:ATP-dependent RNA helicase DeaD